MSDQLLRSQETPSSAEVSPEVEAPPAEVEESSLLLDIKTGVLWFVGHLGSVLPVLVLGILILVTWNELRNIHFRDVRAALRGEDHGPLLIALGVTVLNVVVMGLYDVVAFRLTRAPWRERWKFGSVAFAWSNFLTLGPLAGPAVRFWLYRPWVDAATDIQGGVVAVVLGFTSGLAAWTLSALVTARVAWLDSIAVMMPMALVLTAAIAFPAGAILGRTHRQFTSGNWRAGLAMVFVGWIDWLLAATAFTLCMQASPLIDLEATDAFRTFFIGQVIGLASLIPGGLGSSDAFWVAHIPVPESVATAALLLYRGIYYILPWLFASLMLVGWATHRATKRIELARGIIGALVGAGGLVMLLSTASPALAARLMVLERVVPLGLVELGYAAAGLGGLLLLVLARGLARGYKSAVHATYLILMVAGTASLLKGLDWEEVVVLSGIGLVLWTQSALFDRPSRKDWLERGDVWLALVGFFAFTVVGMLTRRIDPSGVDDRLFHIGYHVEAGRFVRTLVALGLGTGAAFLYTLLRAPVEFVVPPEDTLQRALDMHRAFGGSSTPLTAANGDKQIFLEDGLGFCLFRTIGPYVVVFSDPVVRNTAARSELLDRFKAFAASIDRRPLFYQISPDWLPTLHDHGFAFFKLGEEALVPLSRVTLDGHAGKIYRQLLKRGEKDRARFRVMPPEEVRARMSELREVSDDWLLHKDVHERQFSIGYFDEAYLSRFPCAVIEHPVGGPEPTRIIAFANLLLGPEGGELSVDLMRYREDAPRVMDFLFAALFLHGKELGYRYFNLGMAPLASVGAVSGAHGRERLARLVFQHGENWYNFQGLRYYKQKWEPEWVPRYMAYENPWDWAPALANVSALIAGGWLAFAHPRFKRS